MFSKADTSKELTEATVSLKHDEHKCSFILWFICKSVCLNTKVLLVGRLVIPAQKVRSTSISLDR